MKNKIKNRTKFEDDADESVIESDSFKIKIKGNNIYFTGEINETVAHELSIIIDQLEHDLSDKENKIVYFHICSPGGCLISSLRIYDRLKYSSLNFAGILEGSVASGATIIMCGCDFVMAYPNTEVMIHELSSGMYGRFSESTNELNRLKTLMEKAMAIYNDKIKKPKDKFDYSYLEKDQYIPLAKCKAIGLIDQIIGEEK